MRIGIVGHEAKKFTPRTENIAREVIRSLLEGATLVVSGHCPLGGIDIWAEEEADRLGIAKMIFPPTNHQWEPHGFKERNIEIAETSDIVHNLVVKELPPEYTGRRFTYCYHCHTRDHVKSGGCWTAKYAENLGKPAVWHVIA